MPLLEHKPINWGILGLGAIAHKFATDLASLSDSKLYAVASRSQEKANAFASQHKAFKAYGSYQDLVSDPHIDAIYIATPHALHKENTLNCLKNGKAVLCEKPFGMNLIEVDEMIRCAKAHNTLLMEALWTYFLPHYQFVLNTIKSKTYGELLNMEASFGFFKTFDNQARLFNKKLGGGSLLDIGIYPIFVALTTLGEPKKISASAHFFENNTDATCNILFEYENNKVAKLKSALTHELPNTAIFYCEKATIKIKAPFHAPTNVSIIINDQEEIEDFNYSSIGYNYEISHFNKLLRTHKIESDLMTFDLSRKLIKLLDHVRQIIDLNY